MKRKLGTRVKILGGMSEFVGKTGEIVDYDPRDRLYRVELDEPVLIPGIGAVTDDLWGGEYLKTLRGGGR